MAFQKTSFLILFLFAQLNFAQKLEEENNDIIFDGHFEAPIYPKCIFDINKERLLCFQEKMNLHFKEHFNYPKKAFRKKIQGNYVITFKVDKAGNIIFVSMTGNDINDKIQNEIKRVFLLLPKIKPGKNNNKEVSVNYSIPIKLAVN